MSKRIFPHSAAKRKKGGSFLCFRAKGTGHPADTTAILIDLCKISILIQLGEIEISVLLDGFYEELVDLLKCRMEIVVLPYISFGQQPDIFDRILIRSMRGQLDTSHRPLFGRPAAVELLQEVDHGPLSMIGRPIPDQQQPLSRIPFLQFPDKAHRIFGVTCCIRGEYKLSEKDIQGTVVGLSRPVVIDG